MKRRDYSPQDANCYLCREKPIEADSYQMPHCEIQRLSQTWFWKYAEYILVFLDKVTDEFVDQLEGFRTPKEAREQAMALGFKPVRDY